MLTSKIQAQHRQKMAYVYLRQSTMAQVFHHQESTQRQYALKDKALELGWTPDQIRVLDADLGISGTQMNNRQDFQTLVADVSLEKVGRCSPWKFRAYRACAAIGIACWRFVR
jgi:hypothetical protein